MPVADSKAPCRRRALDSSPDIPSSPESCHLLVVSFPEMGRRTVAFSPASPWQDSSPPPRPTPSLLRRLLQPSPDVTQVPHSSVGPPPFQGWPFPHGRGDGRLSLQSSPLRRSTEAGAAAFHAVSIAAGILRMGEPGTIFPADNLLEILHQGSGGRELFLSFEASLHNSLQGSWGALPRVIRCPRRSCNATDKLQATQFVSPFTGPRRALFCGRPLHPCLWCCLPHLGRPAG